MNTRISFIIFALVISSALITLDIPQASAEIQTLGTFKQNSCVNLKQTCSNCTFVNISSVIYPNSSTALQEVTMTKVGSEYNYNFCKTPTNGQYIYNTLGDPEGILTTEPVNFYITPSGTSNNIWFYILIIIISYGIAFTGFFGRNEWVTIFGGLIMISLGLFIINNGLEIYRNTFTDVFSWITIGLGSFLSIYSAVSILEDNL